MRDALLRDLSELNQYQLISMVDARLLPSDYASKNLMVAAGKFNQVFKKALKDADLVWLIAPETNGVLLELTELCLATEEKEGGATFLGCGYDATLAGTSKSLSFEALKSANIGTLAVYSGDELMQTAYFNSVAQLNHLQWLAKPEDGAGCEGIRLFDSLDALRLWLKQDDRYLNYFAQTYQSGISASFSMICRDGKGWLLSGNQQHIKCTNGQFKLTGISVNSMQNYSQRFETLARKIAKMLPDALGYIGVDVIIDTQNGDIFVIDINPRLTSSYTGLREAIGHNPAQLILSCILEPHFTLPVLQKNIVEIAL